MRHSIAWPAGVSRRAGSSVEPLAARDPDLPPHQIDAGHHLGDRMLDLQPRVHLEEVEAAVLVEQELDRAGVGVADRARDAAAAPTSSPARIAGVTASDGVSSTTFWWRRWIEHSRSTNGSTVPWWSASSCTSMCRGRDQAALEIDGGVAERGAGLRARRAHGAGQVRRIGRPCACPCRRRRPPPSRAADSRSRRRRRGDLGVRHARRRAASRCRARPARRRASPRPRAAVLLPISAIASGAGPMNVSPASRTAAAKSSFSARKP